MLLSEDRWYRIQVNVDRLAEWLIDNCYLIGATHDDTARLVLWMLRNPWRYEKEWKLYQAWIAADSEERRNAIEDALLDERTIEDVISETE